jgi:predicted ribosome quality control (RQC) complex YloA/Tae2 family protein
VLWLRKKEFTSFDIAAAIKEMETQISNSRVNNIYQFDEKTFVFKLHKIDTPPIRLVIESGRRLHLTEYAEESPAAPPAFCMTMRKYLRDSWLRSIKQLEFERIVIIRFETKTGTLCLVVELFGEGNIILTNEKNVIIHALEFKRMRDRNILRNEPLVFPPAIGKNPFEVSISELHERLMNTGKTEIVKTLAKFLGIGGLYAEELLLKASVEKTKASNSLKDEKVKDLFEALQTILENVSNGSFQPNVVVDENGDFLDVVPIKLKQYESCKILNFASFNQALDEFYLKITAIEKAVQRVETGKLKQEALRLRRVVDEQEKAIEEDQKKSNHSKQIGDLIYAHLAELQSFQEQIITANQRGHQWTEIVARIMAAKKEEKTPSAYVESFDSKNLALNLRIESYNFSYNLRNSLFENANRYYEKGKLAKEKAEGASLALKETKRKLEQAEFELKEAEKLQNLKPAEIMEELSKRKEEMMNKQWYEKFRWFISSEDFLVVAGKDTVSNEVLIKKYTKQEDIVFHAEITGAPFVVVKTEGKSVGKPTEQEAAEFAASFSRAWRENAGTVDVYWVRLDQLSKSGPSGESIPHGAFFVVGKRNWYNNTVLRVAVGINAVEEDQFIGGPVSAVQAQTKNYVIILPGDMTGKDLLRQVLKSLTSKLSKDQREKIGKTSIEQIREFIPYTKGSINIKPTR